MDKNISTKKGFMPVLFSLPVVQTLSLPSRAELLPQIESGQLEYMDFRARVFGTGTVSNPVMFLNDSLEAFAASFEGKPFLRDHDQYEIESREGTILSSKLDPVTGEFVQDIRITTRRGMTDYIEGRIDRFSIGWDCDQILCSICEMDYFGGQCSHVAGRSYDSPLGSKTCLLVMINPTGTETSAVNVPAVEGTHVEAMLQKMKLSLLQPAEADGQAPVAEADSPASPVSSETEGSLARLAQVRDDYREINLRSLQVLKGDTTVNIREKMQARATKLERAQQLVDLKDTESRDFTEDERAEFGTCLSEADTLAAEIAQDTDEREKLRAAVELKLGASESQKAERPETPEPAAPAKVKTLAEFNQLSPKERMAFVKDGGTIQQ